MDGFGDNFVPNGEAVDPAAEFLAREQDELAGLEDPPVPVVKTDPASVTSEAEPLAEATAAPSIICSDDQFPEAEPAAPEEAPAPPVVVVVEAMQRTPERVLTPVPRIEPEAIREWREGNLRKLVEKDEAEDEAKKALREKARQELVDWYKQHDDQVAKTRQANRCAEKELVADTERPEPGTEWERIAKLCDFNPKTAKSSRDVSRMRSIILHVKQSPPVKA